MPTTAALEISAEAEAATLGLLLLCGGCGELGRGASIAALARTSGERPRLRATAGGRRRAAARDTANCCFGVGLGFFFSFSVFDVRRRVKVRRIDAGFSAKGAVTSRFLASADASRACSKRQRARWRGKHGPGLPRGSDASKGE